MEIDYPKIDMLFMPEGTTFVIYAKDQKPLLPLPVVRTPNGRVVSAWRPTLNDLLMLHNGAHIYLTVSTGNQPLQPVMLTVGQPDLRNV